MTLSANALKLGAVAVTVLSLAGATVYVATYPKNPAAPLQPQVVKVSAPSAPGVATIRGYFKPSVRVADLPALTFSHVS